MTDQVYNFTIGLTWKNFEQLRGIEKFELVWANHQRIESSSLNQLKTLATIQSIGASTRIEGSKLSDKQVQRLLEKIDVTQIEDRDSQEVVGYFNVLDIVSESSKDITISESSIKNLHNVLLKLSEKDSWHRGKYKKLSNPVQANFPDGSTQIIFKTTAPGYATEEAMKSLVGWYNSNTEISPIIKTAVFVYEFLSIHPFQDGNGRLSRLLTTHLLMQNGYDWVEYISFEHEIEKRKKEYYQALRNSQAQRPNEDVTVWTDFFVTSLLNLIQKLNKKLEISQTDLTPKQKGVYVFICNNPESKVSKIIEGTEIPRATLKRILRSLLEREMIQKKGNGAGTYYIMNPQIN